MSKETITHEKNKIKQKIPQAHEEYIQSRICIKDRSDSIAVGRFALHMDDPRWTQV